MGGARIVAQNLGESELYLLFLKIDPLAAPRLIKKIERVEANMFAFFIALILQALLEREVCN